MYSIFKNKIASDWILVWGWTYGSEVMFDYFFFILFNDIQMIQITVQFISINITILGGMSAFWKEAYFGNM